MTEKRQKFIDRVHMGGDCNLAATEYLEELQADLIHKLLVANDPLLMKKHQGDLLRIKDLLDIFSKAR